MTSVEQKHPEEQYLEVLRLLLVTPGRGDRTGTGTRSIFSDTMTFDLANGFPLFTTKKLPFKVIAAELLWFLSGETNVKPLQEQGVSIWNEWADANGDLGPVYGHQWRSWPGRNHTSIDQIGNVIQSLRDDPLSRRHLVTAWNPADVNHMALPPCHCLFQFYVEYDGRLSCQIYQRSADVFLGLPFNIASYALLTELVAKVLYRKPGRLHWVGGDVHLYENHVEQAETQSFRAPRPLPHLDIEFEGDEHMDPSEFNISDFHLIGYDPHPHIAGDVSV